MASTVTSQLSLMVLTVKSQASQTFHSPAMLLPKMQQVTSTQLIKEPMVLEESSTTTLTHLGSVGDITTHIMRLTKS